jgi:sirohydrochlorin ferrochelatase
MRRAILIIDHGSRRAAANARLDDVAAMVRERAGEDFFVQAAHMELAEPSIAQGFAACVDAGAEEVVAVPYFLAPGRHAKEDIPALVAAAAEAHPGVAWRIADVLGPDPLLAELVLRRAALG